MVDFIVITRWSCASSNHKRKCDLPIHTWLTPCRQRLPSLLMMRSTGESTRWPVLAPHQALARPLSGAMGSSVPSPEVLVPLDRLFVVLHLLLGRRLIALQACPLSWWLPCTLCEAIARPDTLVWALEKLRTVVLLVTGTPVTLPVTAKLRSKTVRGRTLKALA